MFNPYQSTQPLPVGDAGRTSRYHHNAAAAYWEWRRRIAREHRTKDLHITYESSLRDTIDAQPDLTPLQAIAAAHRTIAEIYLEELL